MLTAVNSWTVEISFSFIGHQFQQPWPLGCFNTNLLTWWSGFLQYIQSTDWPSAVPFRQLQASKPLSKNFRLQTVRGRTASSLESCRALRSRWSYRQSSVGLPWAHFALVVTVAGHGWTSSAHISISNSRCITHFLINRVILLPGVVPILSCKYTRYCCFIGV